MVLPATSVLAQPIAVGSQTALEHGGPFAARIGDLWNLMLVTSTVITLLVLVGFAWAIFRRRARTEVPEADRAPDARGERFNDESGGRGLEGVGRPWSERVGVRFMLWAGVVFPVIVLGGVLVYMVRVLADVSLPARSVAEFDAPPAPGELVVQVTGLQYWWEIEYLDVQPQRRFETANELHIPVGRTVTVRLRSADVIHSFWVPGLHGKMDLVPGRVNAIALRADRAGIYRGQCAEFCGVQHAKMAFTVVAESPEAYEAWATRQRTAARAPHDSASAADRDVFLTSGCALCHTVRGTVARGEAGPDLTHLATRATLAAGTLPNTAGHLFGWIADPQAVKPGSRMPSVPLTPHQLHAIVRYLRSLE